MAVEGSNSCVRTHLHQAKMLHSVLLIHVSDTLDELCLLYNSLLPVTTIRTAQAAEVSATVLALYTNKQ